MEEEIKNPNQLDLFAGIVLTTRQQQLIDEFIKSRSKTAKIKETQNQSLEKALVDDGFVFGMDFENTFKIVTVKKEVSLGYYEERFSIELEYEAFEGDIRLLGKQFESTQNKIVNARFYIDAEFNRNGVKVSSYSIMDNYRKVKPSTMLQKLKEYNERQQYRFEEFNRRETTKQNTLKKYQEKYPNATVTPSTDWDKYSGTFNTLVVGFPSGSYIVFRLWDKENSETVHKVYDAEFKKLNIGEVLDKFSKQEGSN